MTSFPGTAATQVAPLAVTTNGTHTNDSDNHGHAQLHSTMTADHHNHFHKDESDDQLHWLSSSSNSKISKKPTPPRLSELAAQADAAGLLRLSLWTDGGDADSTLGSTNLLDPDNDPHHDDSVLDWLGQDDPDDPAAAKGTVKQAFFHPIPPLAPPTASSSASPSPIDLNSQKALSLADMSLPGGSPTTPLTPSPLSNPPPPSASSKTSSIRFSNLLLDGVGEDLNATTLELRPLSLTDMKVDLELLERSKNRAKNRRAMMLAHQDSESTAVTGASSNTSKDTLPLTPTPDIPHPGQGLPGRGASAVSSVDSAATDPTTPTTVSVTSSFANLHLGPSSAGSRSPSSPVSTTVASSLTSLGAASTTSRAASSEQLAIMRSLLASTASAEHARAKSPNPSMAASSSTVPPTPSTIGADDGSQAFPSSAPSVTSSSPPLDPLAHHYALPSPTALSTWSAPEPVAMAPTAHRRTSVTSDRSTGSGSTATFRSGVPRPARSVSRSRAASSAASTTSSAGGTTIAPPTPRVNYNPSNMSLAGGLGGSLGSLSVPHTSRTRSRSPSAPQTRTPYYPPSSSAHHYPISQQPTPAPHPFDDPSDDLEPMGRVPTPHAAPAAPTPRPLSVTTSGDDVAPSPAYHPHQPSEPMPLPSRTAPPRTPLPSTPARPKTPTYAPPPVGRPKTPTGTSAGTSGIPRPKTPTTGIPRPKTPLSASQSTGGLPRPKTPLGGGVGGTHHGSYQSLLSPPSGAPRRARSPAGSGSLESLIPAPRATSPSPSGPRGGGGLGFAGGLRAPSPTPMRAPSPAMRTPTAEHHPRIPPPAGLLPSTPGARIPPPSNIARARSPSTGAHMYGAAPPHTGIVRAVSPGGLSAASSVFSTTSSGLPRPSGIPRPKTPTRGPSPRPPGAATQFGGRGYQHADSAEF